MPGQTPQDARNPHPLPQEASCPSHKHPDSAVATSFLLPSPVTAPSPPSHCSAPTQLPPHPCCHASPALPACPPSAEATGVRWGAFRGVEPGCTPCPVSSCSPQAAPRGLDKRTGGRLPPQHKTPLLQDTLDPQKGNHSFHRRLLRPHQGRVPDQHVHLGPSGRPFATNGAWIRGSGPRAKG